MTMLVAGHETTAAVLTWAVFLLAQVCLCSVPECATITSIVGCHDFSSDIPVFATPSYCFSNFLVTES